MKRILIISQNFYPEIGSAGNRMKNIYTLLRDNNYEVEVLTTNPVYPNRNLYHNESFWDEPELNEDDRIHRMQIKDRKYSRKIINRLSFYIEMAIKMIIFILFNRKKYDVIYATSPQFFVAIVGLFAKYRYRARFILEIRDLWPESLKGVGVFNYAFIINFFKVIETYLYKQATYIVVNSKGFIDYISSRADNLSSKILYVPNGARMEELENYSNKADTFKVIYAGNIGLAQDSDVIKELIVELNRKNIDLTIISYGLRIDEMKKFTKENRYNNVQFVEPMTRKECFEIISKHHIGIVTLVDEEVFETVLPGKIIDYMTCGVPMVAAVKGFSKENIIKEEVGFVSNDYSAKELMNYIEHLKENQILQQKMCENGKKYVEREFLWEKNIEALVKILT